MTRRRKNLSTWVYCGNCAEYILRHERTEHDYNSIYKNEQEYADKNGSKLRPRSREMDDNSDDVTVSTGDEDDYETNEYEVTVDYNVTCRKVIEAWSESKAKSEAKFEVDLEQDRVDAFEINTEAHKV